MMHVWSVGFHLRQSKFASQIDDRNHLAANIDDSLDVVGSIGNTCNTQKSQDFADFQDLQAKILVTESEGQVLSGVGDRSCCCCHGVSFLKTIVHRGNGYSVG